MREVGRLQSDQRLYSGLRIKSESWIHTYPRSSLHYKADCKLVVSSVLSVPADIK